MQIAKTVLCKRNLNGTLILLELKSKQMYQIDGFAAKLITQMIAGESAEAVIRSEAQIQKVDLEMLKKKTEKFLNQMKKLKLVKA
jgi:hypothetical protein